MEHNEVGTRKHSIVIGAGLVGALWSIYLSKLGHKVSIYERRPDLRTRQADQGRSINLALSHRGLHALERVGLKDKVSALGIPMHGRHIHKDDGSEDFHPYGYGEESILSISRAKLNALLLDLAEEDARQHQDRPVFFEHRCTSIDLDTPRASFVDEYRNVDVSVQPDHIFGADGANSTLRSHLMRKRRYNYQQEFLEHGYLELDIPAQSDGTHALSKNALHIWPRNRFMLIALPNLDGSFTATLFLSHEKDETSFSQFKNPKDFREFFDTTFPNASKLMPELEKDFVANPISDLGTVKCFPWYHEDKAMLLGDAAHAIVPFYGQGLNAGFEDCRLLYEAILKHGDWGHAFEIFSNERKADADAIADLAKDNFIEMRDRVVDEEYLRVRALEHTIQEHFPKRYKNLYRLVTFSDTPYQQARQMGRQNIRFVKGLLKHPDIDIPIKDQTALALLQQRVEAFLE